jgi:hypothetical protein
VNDKRYSSPQVEALLYYGPTYELCPAFPDHLYQINYLLNKKAVGFTYGDAYSIKNNLSNG